MTSAVLTFTVYQISTGYQDPGARISVYKITRAWDQESVTWLKATSSANWSQAGGDVGSTAIVTAGYANTGTESFTITSAVQDFVRTPSSNFGVYLKVTKSKIQKHGLRSSEYATVAERPRLVVTYSVGSTRVAMPQGQSGTQRGRLCVLDGLNAARGAAVNRQLGIDGRLFGEGDVRAAAGALRTLDVNR